MEDSWYGKVILRPRYYDDSRKHRLQDGVYVRVARRLGVDPSYVSKVASGKIISLEIYRALLKELQRIERR